MMRSFFDPNIFEIYHSLSLSLSRHFSSLYLYEILYSFKKKKKENRNTYSKPSFQF